MVKGTFLCASPSTQNPALIGHATEALTRQNPGAVSVDLPSGVVARMFCRRISGNSPFPDGVVHVKLTAAAVPALASAQLGSDGVEVHRQSRRNALEDRDERLAV